MKEKTPKSHEVVSIQMLDFETSNSKPEVSKSNSKTPPLQKEPFLTIFNTLHYSLPSRFFANNYFE